MPCISRINGPRYDPWGIFYVPAVQGLVDVIERFGVHSSNRLLIINGTNFNEPTNDLFLANVDQAGFKHSFWTSWIVLNVSLYYISCFLNVLLHSFFFWKERIF